MPFSEISSSSYSKKDGTLTSSPPSLSYSYTPSALKYTALEIIFKNYSNCCLSTWLFFFWPLISLKLKYFSFFESKSCCVNSSMFYCDFSTISLVSELLTENSYFSISKPSNPKKLLNLGSIVQVSFLESLKLR